MTRERDPEEDRAEWEDAQAERDEARADDFRCHGCETPLPIGRRGGLCFTCREEEGGEG